MRTLADSSETLRLLEQAEQGDRCAFNLLVSRHQDELYHFVHLRLDPRVRARIDAADIVQDTHLEAFQRLAEFCRRRPMPFQLWLRKNAYDRLRNVFRDHVSAARRSVSAERPMADVSSVLIARTIAQQTSTPSEQVSRQEYREKVTRAIDQLAESDREVLLLRHVDQMSHREIACLLDISGSAARQRYARALVRLEQQLREHGIDGTF